MKALFIGGTGTISTSVTELALKRGWDITLLNRGSRPVPEGMDTIVADIHDEEAVEKAIQVLLDEAGRQFDPKLVPIFVGLVQSGAIDLKAQTELSATPPTVTLS